MTPLERYQADLKRPDFFHDAAQETAVRHLQRLYDDLIAADKGSAGVFGKLFGKKPQGPVKGLYFWGGVGRGKTYLVDTFFDALPFERKVRTRGGAHARMGLAPSWCCCCWEGARWL